MPPLRKNTVSNDRVRRLRGQSRAKDARPMVLGRVSSFHSWKGGGLNSLEVDINIAKYTEGECILY